jgi:hypothetical protein
MHPNEGHSQSWKPPCLVTCTAKLHALLYKKDANGLHQLHKSYNAKSKALTIEMARILKSLGFFIVLLLSSEIFMSEARPLHADKPRSSITKGVEIFVGGRLDIKGIKTGGPSPGGEGHGITNARSLGVVKNSGPGPGEGH